MTETRPPYDLDKSAFAGLFQKHPWLLPILAMLNRQMGILREFYEREVKPFNQKR